MNTHPTPDELQAALTRLIEGEAEPHDDTLVAEMLRSHPALQTQLRQQLQLDALLRLEAEPTAAAFVESVAARTQPPANEAAFLQRVKGALRVLPDATTDARPRRSVWLQWRPLTAAAAGIVFGMFCTSVVYGLVAQRAGVVKRVPLAVFDPGLENTAPITEHGVPHRVGEWGADSAQVVTAENGVEPLEGRRMLRLEPIPREKEVKDHSSRAYQMLDLRTLPMASLVGDTEVQVKASFFATKSEVSSRYSIRIFALDEAPEQARKDFWPKTQGGEVVIAAQRFDTSPGDRGWHTFSLKMPLPRGARTLVFILSAVAPEDASVHASVHYLDDVQVSVLTALNKVTSALAESPN